MVRIDWTDGESEIVLCNVINILGSNPDIAVSKLLKQAQDLLPAGRQRKITGWSQAKPLFVAVRARLDEHPTVRAQLPDDSPLRTGIISRGEQTVKATQPKVDPVEEKFKDFERRLVDFRQQLAEAKAELDRRDEAQLPTKEEIIESASTEELILVLIKRANVAIAAAIAGNVQSGVVSVVKEASERNFHSIQESLHGIHNLLASSRATNGVPLIGAPGQLGESQYMPEIYIAGASRQDFQRLQTSLIKVGVRLYRVDLDKQAGLPKHDRLLILKNNVPIEISQSLQARYKQTVVLDGSLHAIQSFICAEVKRIRAERQAKQLPEVVHANSQGQV